MRAGSRRVRPAGTVVRAAKKSSYASSQGGEITVRRTLIALAAVATGLSLLPGTAVTVDVGTPPTRCPSGTGYTCTDQFIESFDNARLDTTFYLPTGATLPVAAILMTHGYGGWHRSDGDLNSQVMLAQAGYAVLAYTSRGFGRSEGTVALQSPAVEVRDAGRLLDWLANRQEVRQDGPGDPRVGMFGGSYAGGIQLLTAAYDPAHRLDAITPQITWNDLRYSLSPNGVTKHGWIDLLYASGKFSGYFGPIGAPRVVSTEGVPADQDVQVLTSYLTNENVTTPIAYSDGSTSSYEYIARRSVAYNNVIANITAPTFLIQGQQDTLFTMNEALRNFSGIGVMQNVPRKLLMFSAGHGYSDLRDPSEPTTVVAKERREINARILAWFDRYLNGNPNATTGPQVEVWRPWVTGPNFAEPGSATMTPVALSGPASATIVNAVVPTSHTEVTNFQPTVGAPSFDSAPGVTSQDYTAAIGSTTYLFGLPELRFTISSVAPEAIVFAKLWDEAPGGSRTLIHHLVTPARVRDGVGDFCSGYLPGATLATSVQPTSVCLQMAGITWKLETGHTLVLTMATSDSTHWGSRYPGAYQVSGVSLKLPVVGSF